MNNFSTRIVLREVKRYRAEDRTYHAIVIPVSSEECEKCEQYDGKDKFGDPKCKHEMCVKHMKEYENHNAEDERYAEDEF